MTKHQCLRAGPASQNFRGHIRLETMASTANQSDIMIDDNAFELLSERPFAMIRMCRSVFESDDPDWKVKLAEEAIESIGICSKFVHECFLLHNTELLYKGPSDMNWRLVKLGLFSTIAIQAASIGIIVASYDDMDLGKADKKREVKILEQENSTISSLRRRNPVRGICHRSSFFSDNNDNTLTVSAFGTSPGAEIEHMRILNETVNSLDISEEEIDLSFTDVFADAP